MSVFDDLLIDIYIFSSFKIISEVYWVNETAIDNTVRPHIWIGYRKLEVLQQTQTLQNSSGRKRWKMYPLIFMPHLHQMHECHTALLQHSLLNFSTSASSSHNSGKGWLPIDRKISKDFPSAEEAAIQSCYHNCTTFTKPIRLLMSSKIQNLTRHFLSTNEKSLNKQEIEKYIQKKWRSNRLQSILCLHI